jgi:iron(II)-dependent oxidoreductase
MIAAAGLALVALALVSTGCNSTPSSGFDLVEIPGGTFVMGDAEGEADEAPRRVTVEPFRLMRTEVTNRMFKAFIDSSGHRTDGERSGVGNVWDGKWRRVSGADWRNPFGPESSIAGREDYPVIQVSARDASAFCRFYGLRLPTEAEWEFAARGTDGRRFPWGNAAPDDGSMRRANFGTVECCAPSDNDGYETTAPVGSFPSGVSPFGVLDMAGNVWEWTASEFPGRPGSVTLRGGGWGNNPYCLRVSYRHANPPDIGLDMVGFRCAADAARD